MLIRFEELLVGDEIIIPSNSNLKYLKVVKLVSDKSIKCSYHKSDKDNPTFISTGARWQKPNTCVDDINKHNRIFYLLQESGYRDMWVVKRELW